MHYQIMIYLSEFKLLFFFSNFHRSDARYFGNDEDKNVLLFQWCRNKKHSDVTFPHSEASLDTEINMSLSVRCVGKPPFLATS